MSKAQELADQLEALDKGLLTSMWAREGDKEVVAELRRLDRVNAELVEALLDEAEEWSRYVVEDTAPMTLRKYLERKVAALSSSGGTES